MTDKGNPQDARNVLAYISARGFDPTGMQAAETIQPAWGKALQGLAGQMILKKEAWNHILRHESYC